MLSQHDSIQNPHKSFQSVLLQANCTEEYVSILGNWTRIKWDQIRCYRREWESSLSVGVQGTGMGRSTGWGWKYG